MANIFRLGNLKKTLSYLKRNGIKNAYYAARERIETEKGEHYVYEQPQEKELQRQREVAGTLHTRFSVIVPAYETKEEYLRAMLDSVLQQTYGNFELILADASKSDQVMQIIGEYQDKRIQYRRLKQNNGISANTNQALMYATGDYAALLDHDDTLTPDALYEMAAEIERQEKDGIELRMLYSDEDKCDSSGTHFFEVNKKQKFNLDLTLSNNYICHFLVMKRQLMQELGFRSVCDGAQDYDLVLRAVSGMMGKDKRRNTIQELPIAHVPKVLYHWRCHQASTAENPDSKQYAYDAGKRALQDFLRSREWKGTVQSLKHLGFYRIEFQPDLLTNRSDVAVIGGRLVNAGNIITGGIYDDDGVCPYLGLHKEYSGPMHRAVLRQEAYAVDVRCMLLSSRAEKIMEELLGLPYLREIQSGRFNWQDSLNQEADYVELSLKFCEKIRQQGMRILWDPQMTEKIK